MVIAAITCLHEHVESPGDDRSGPAREEGRRAWHAPASPGSSRASRPVSKVVTEYYDTGRPDAVPRRARLPYGRLRLHDVHRELRPATRGDLRGNRGGRPRRLLPFSGEPQLRGAHPSGGEGELPRLAAARGGVRPRGTHGHRPRQRAARSGRRTATTSTSATCGRAPEEIQETMHTRGTPATCSPATYADVFTGDPARGRELPIPEGRSVRLGFPVHVRTPAAGTSRDVTPEPEPVEDFGGSAVPRPWLGDSVTTDHISPAGGDQAGHSPAGKYLVRA